MGNSLRGIRLLSKGDCSYYVHLGKSATIDLTERKIEQNEDGTSRETWGASYTVNGSTCKLALHKTRGADKKGGEFIHIEFHDDLCAGGGCHSRAERVPEASLLNVSNICCKSEKMSTTESNILNARGGYTATRVAMYGNEKSGGLFVSEWKKDSKEGKPYMGTVAHYYAYSTANVFSKTDIGLSVVVKIRVSEDYKLDFVVDGPVQHPAAGLFYMFENVFRDRRWKPTDCPHCKDLNSIIERQRNTFGQTENEDNDNPPTAGPHSRKQNAGGVLRNSGLIHGNQKGNIYVGGSNSLIRWDIYGQ